LSGRLSGSAGQFRRKKRQVARSGGGNIFPAPPDNRLFNSSESPVVHHDVHHSPAIFPSTPPLFSGPEAARTLPPLMCKPHRRKKRLVSPFLEHVQATPVTPLTLTTVPPQLLQQRRDNTPTSVTAEGSGGGSGGDGSSSCGGDGHGDTGIVKGIV
jgi:hypothetical protein